MLEIQYFSPILLLKPATSELMYIRCTVPELSSILCCLKNGMKSIILTGGCITRKYRWQIRHRIRHRINEQTNRTDIMIHRSSARVRAPIIPLQVSKYLFIICLFDHLKHNTCRESEFELLNHRTTIQSCAMVSKWENAHFFRKMIFSKILNHQ